MTSNEIRKLTNNLNSVEQELLQLIRRYPGIYPHKNAVLEHMLLGNGTGYEWQPDGTLATGYPETEKPEVTTKAAYYMLISDKFCALSYYVEWAPIFNIPENVHKDWLWEIQSFMRYYLLMPVAEYKALLWAKCLQSYGIKNPNSKIWFDRGMKEYKETKTKMLEVAKAGGKEWAWVWKKPTKKQVAKTNDMIQKILDEVLMEGDAA